MKIFKIIFLTIYVLILFSTPIHAQPKGLEQDKSFVLHIIVSCTIDVVAYNYYVKNTNLDHEEAQIAAFSTAMTIGFLKEFIDPKFDWGDILADSIGAGIGLGISIKF